MEFEPTTPNTKIEIGLQSKQRYVKTITFTSGHISFHMWPGYETKYLQLTPQAFKDYSCVGREKKLYSNVASCLNVYTSLAIYTGAVNQDKGTAQQSQQFGTWRGEDHTRPASCPQAYTSYRDLPLLPCFCWGTCSVVNASWLLYKFISDCLFVKVLFSFLVCMRRQTAPRLPVTPAQLMRLGIVVGESALFEVWVGLTIDNRA